MWYEKKLEIHKIYRIIFKVSKGPLTKSYFFVRFFFIFLERKSKKIIIIKILANINRIELFLK
jgi:hypothetical protein